jgi:NADH:ubiquinone oxidoreductase subunit 4 (subunit M)
MLRGVRNVLHGPIPDHLAQVTDATLWRKLPFALLLAGLLGFGILPNGLVQRIKPAAEVILKAASPQTGTVETVSLKPAP